jgi:hypothetical protein
MPWYFIITEIEEGKGHSGPAAKGYLQSPNGRRWPAVSGPWGRGHLETGSYTISNCGIRTNNDSKKKKAMSDIAGNFWSCNIKPNFHSSRKNLRIHPDGNVYGTEGCIGIRQADTLEVLNALENSSDDEIRVYVSV